MFRLYAARGELPAPEDYDVDLPPAVWQAVKETARVTTTGREASGAMSDIMIRSLRNKIKAVEEELKKREEESVIDVTPVPPQRALPAPVADKTRLFKKFN